MKTKKTTKNEQIKQLKDELFVSKASQLHNLHFSSLDIEKCLVDRMTGSGVIITIQSLNCKNIVNPTLISNGLSPETVKAIQKDLVASYKHMTEFKPKEV